MFRCIDTLILLNAVWKAAISVSAKEPRFQDSFINKVVKSLTEAAGGDDFIVVYGDGIFSLTMKGMDNGASAHK